MLKNQHCCINNSCVNQSESKHLYFLTLIWMSVNHRNHNNNSNSNNNVRSIMSKIQFNNNISQKLPYTVKHTLLHNNRWFSRKQKKKTVFPIAWSVVCVWIPLSKWFCHYFVTVVFGSLYYVKLCVCVCVYVFLVMIPKATTVIYSLQTPPASDGDDGGIGGSSACSEYGTQSGNRQLNVPLSDLSCSHIAIGSIIDDCPVFATISAWFILALGKISSLSLFFSLYLSKKNLLSAQKCSFNCDSAQAQALDLTWLELNNWTKMTKIHL